MKKRYHIIALLCCTMTMLISCSDWLELKPEDSTIEEDFWRNGNQVESVVRACYRFMQEDDIMQRMLVYGELRSDEVQNGPSISSVETDIINANVRSANGYCNWAAFYRVINYCNKVIEQAPGVMLQDANFNETTCHAYMAEAYTLRALCYFYLIRTFRNVPLIVTSSSTDEYDYNISNQDTVAWIDYYNLPVDQQSFVAENYPLVSQEKYVVDNMIESLEKAIDYAATEWEDEEETRGRVTRRAAEALLADYCLWRAAICQNVAKSNADTDYRRCIDLCNSILDETNSMEMTLTEGSRMLNDIFYVGNSEESIFELNFTTKGYANNTTATFYGNTNKGRNPKLLASISVPTWYNQKAVDNSERYDLRSKDFIVNSSNRIFKYEGQTPATEFSGNDYVYRSASSQANWIFYRMADVYLMKAEALAQVAENASDIDNVVTLCNISYIRACTQNNEVKDSLSHADYTTPSDAQRLVMEERGRELCFEGKRWFDLLRLARRNGDTSQSWDFIESKYDNDVTTIKNKMLSIDAWYLPVYSAEMKINGRLRQTAYYEAQGD